MTPEGKVKKLVTALLKSYPDVHYDMPVPGGWGKSGLDYYGCADGLFFAIETKRPGEEPTDRQKLTIKNMVRSGAFVFVIDGPGPGLDALKHFLEHHAGAHI